MTRVLVRVSVSRSCVRVCVCQCVCVMMVVAMHGRGGGGGGGDLDLKLRLIMILSVYINLLPDCALMRSSEQQCRTLFPAGTHRVYCYHSVIVILEANYFVNYHLKINK